MHIIILILLAAMVLAYDLQCPDLSQRQLRSRGLCVGNSSYTCLEDVNIHTFNESCSEVEAPVRAGRKYVYKGQTTDIECSKHRYQPIKFYKTSAAVCLFLKSLCAEVGQIVARKGSSIIDTTCICDYGEGYAYVTRPADVCSCVPSREDCTCYEKKCPKDHILSADSKCIYRNTPNVTVCATDNKSGKSATTTVRTDFTALNNAPMQSSFHKESNEEHEQQKQISSNVVALGNQMTEVQAWIQETTAERRKCSCYDYHENVTKEWEVKDKVFVKTRVVNVILKKLETNHCITVTGKPGMGKSAIIHHIALLLHRSQGYSIVPCTDPHEIKNHFKKNHLQVFVFDDICGRYSVNHFEVEEWIKHEPNINRILWDNKTKVLSSCRLQVFNEKKFQYINLFKACSIDLTCEENVLTTDEKIQIALKYLDEDIVDRCRSILEKCEFLPLICYLCKQNSPVSVEDFLRNPFDIYTNELNSMKIQLDNTKWCALFLCILHNGTIEESYFELEKDNNRQELQTILDHCSVNKTTSIMHVQEQLESLVGTYMKRKETVVEHFLTERCDKVSLSIIHDKMFDFLCHYYGSSQQKIFIKHAKASVLAERTQLESLNEDHDEFKVIINRENEAGFFQKSLEVWENGGYVSVLKYDQMKFVKYREKLISNIKLLYPVHLRMSGLDLESALNIVCKAGYYDMFCFLLENKSDINHDKLLQSACYGGNVDIVKDLITMGSHVDLDVKSICEQLFQINMICQAFSETDLPKPLINMDVHENREIELRLPSALQEACARGHLPIVTLLIDKGANVNQTINRFSPLISACEGGQIQIVTLLIDKGADINQTTVVFSPLISACLYGHLPIVTLLIDKGADINQKTQMSSPLISACEGGHLPIVILLIDKGADVNQTTDMFSPLIKACLGGHLPIVTLLMDNGADIDQTTNATSPLISACLDGHLPIVTLLIDKGADINQAKVWFSPLAAACFNGHLLIVTLLIDKGADVNQTENMLTPLSAACKGGHLPIVTLLINKGANLNLTDFSGRTPLYYAKNSEIVNLLLKLGASL